MNQQQLLSAAVRIPAPTRATVDEYEQVLDALVTEMNAAVAASPGIAEAIGGDKNRSMMHDNHRYHALFMCSMMRDFRPEVLLETVLWVFRTYRSHGFQPGYWEVQMEQWLLTLERQLSATAFAEVRPIYDYLIVHHSAFVALTDPVRDEYRGGGVGPTP